MEKTSKSNYVDVIICLLFILVLAGINTALLKERYSDYGIYIFFSLFVSVIGIIPALILLFVKSGIPFVTFVKVFTICTFASQGFTEESRSMSPGAFLDLYTYLNIAVVVLSVVSIILVLRNHYTIKNQ